jgi:hypothetical protein
MDSSATARPSATAIVWLSVLVLLAGAGGMAASFLFLCSRHDADVIAGAAGFVAGAILVAAGLLALAIQSQSDATARGAARAVYCLIAFVPPVVAILAWPMLYFGAFIAGVFFMPVVLVGCVVWAWVLSRGVAENVAALLGSTRTWVLRGLIFTGQLVVILASWPLFGWLLDLLSSMGLKIGWS